MIDYVCKDLFMDGSADKQLTIKNDDESIVITNTELNWEEFSLIESLCTEDSLQFGACEASQLKIKISNIFESLVGMWLTVYIGFEGYESGDIIDVPLLDENGKTLLDEDGEILYEDIVYEPFCVGRYKVVSDVPTSDRVYRDLTMYDAMYDIINSDHAEWHDEIFESGQITLTVKEYRDAFFEHIGLEQESVSLINDSMTVERGDVAYSSLSGKDIVSSICQINAVFGHIGRDGVFHYIALDNTGIVDNEAHDIDYSLGEYITCTYEDYQTDKISMVQIYLDDGTLGQTYGNGENSYEIKSNILVNGKTVGSMEAEASNILSAINNISFRPFEGECVGNLCVEVGDSIRLTTTYADVVSYVLSRTYKGIQANRDTYSADGAQSYSTDVNSLSNTIETVKIELSKTAAVLAVTITNVDIEYAVGDSDTEAPEEGWNTIAPTAKDGEYVWQRVATTFADETTDYSDPVCITSAAGADGVGVESIVEQYYQSSSNTELTGGSWVGSYPGTKENYYTWTRSIITYTDGTYTETDPVCVTGERGATGDIGEPGVGIETIVNYYALSTSSTSVTGTYSTTVPTLTSTEKYLWNYEVVTYTDGSIETTSAVVIGVYGDMGDDGVGISDITEYYALSTSASSVTGTYSTTVPTLTSTEKYLWNHEVITYTDGSIKVTTARVIGVYGDTGEDGTMLYGTCSTAAGTATKVVACADATSLYAGLTILINFSVGNSARAIMLNVNSLGAKYVYLNGIFTSKGNEFLWTADTSIQFTYNGSYWEPVGQPCSYIGDSSTAADTAAKVVSIDDCVICMGTSLSVKFTYANTAANPTLNVNGTGAKQIYTQGVAYAYWSAGATVDFTFDGTYWRVSSEPVYASTVTVGNSAEQHIYIDSDSMDIMNGTDILASFMPSGIIFNAYSEGHTELDILTYNWNDETFLKIYGIASKSDNPHHTGFESNEMYFESTLSQEYVDDGTNTYASEIYLASNSVRLFGEYMDLNATELRFVGTTYFESAVYFGTSGSYSIKTDGIATLLSIELSFSTPYIDFHYGKSTADYTARIIESSSGKLVAYSSISSSSDERLKKDIVDMNEEYVSLLNQLRPVEYRFIKGDEYLNIGFIAQDVDETLDSLGITDKPLVFMGGDGYYALDYNQVTAILVAGYQNHDTEIEDLKEQIKSLQMLVEKTESNN